MDFYTGERHAGGQVITASAPADRIPLFERGGYVIPMYDAAPLSTMGHYPELLELHVIVPDEDGDTAVHAARGRRLEQCVRRGALLRTTFTVSRRGERVTVSLQHVRATAFPSSAGSRLRFLLKGWSGDRVELDGRPTLVQDCQFECENRGEACSFSFSV